jgi:hypothetical protein
MEERNIGSHEKKRSGRAHLFHTAREARVRCDSAGVEASRARRLRRARDGEAREVAVQRCEGAGERASDAQRSTGGGLTDEQRRRRSRASSNGNGKPM